jgi:uncharacterized OB-fold protein
MSATEVKSPSSEFQPHSNRDYEFFYEGLRRKQILVQKCNDCGTLRSPPSPSCRNCRSFGWEPIALSGKGTINSYTVHHHPPLPGFAVPHAVILADMEEGVRMVGGLVIECLEGVVIGSEVLAKFPEKSPNGVFQFFPVSQ